LVIAWHEHHRQQREPDSRHRPGWPYRPSACISLLVIVAAIMLIAYVAQISLRLKFSQQSRLSNHRVRKCGIVSAPEITVALRQQNAPGC
jgi:hypothetical protein